MHPSSIFIKLGQYSGLFYTHKISQNVKMLGLKSHSGVHYTCLALIVFWNKAKFGINYSLY